MGALFREGHLKQDKSSHSSNRTDLFNLRTGPAAGAASMAELPWLVRAWALFQRRLRAGMEDRTNRMENTPNETWCVERVACCVLRDGVTRAA